MYFDISIDTPKSRDTFQHVWDHRSLVDIWIFLPKNADIDWHLLTLADIEVFLLWNPTSAWKIGFHFPLSAPTLLALWVSLLFSEFKSFASATISLDVLLHLLKVVLQLLDPVRSSSGCDGELVSVIPDNARDQNWILAQGNINNCLLQMDNTTRFWEPMKPLNYLTCQQHPSDCQHLLPSFPPPQHTRGFLFLI